MPIVEGQPATFQFWNLSPSTSYFVNLTSGATYSGAVFQVDSVITNVAVNDQQLSFDTAASDSQWLSGALCVGLMITSESFHGQANIAAPVVLEVDCLGSTTTQAETFSVGIGIQVPPTCVVCGAGPDSDCPSPLTLCGYMGQFYCCLSCPEDK